ncbi:MAG: hypothetical protein ACLTIG_10860 [Roseburia hominis]
MKRKYEVIGIVIDTEKEAEKCSFLSAVLDCKIENFAKITDFFGGDRKVREYFSNLPTLKMIHFQFKRCWNLLVWK